MSAAAPIASNTPPRNGSAASAASWPAASVMYSASSSLPVSAASISDPAMFAIISMMVCRSTSPPPTRVASGPPAPTSSVARILGTIDFWRSDHSWLFWSTATPIAMNTVGIAKLNRIVQPMPSPS